MSSNSSTASANLALDRSKCCRFCTKNLTCIGTKVPRISLYNVVKNKALLAFTGTKSLVLADVVESLGHKTRATWERGRWGREKCVFLISFY